MASLVPKSNSTVRVRAIDTTTNQVVETKAFYSPALEGQETLNLPTLAFLVEHEKLGKKVLFDGGGRKDFQKFHPKVLEAMNHILIGLDVEKDLDEILEEAGITLTSIDSMIWSHWHWDHHGAPDRFPPNVEVVVGPRFKEFFMPGFPTRPEAILSDDNFRGREVREIAFDDAGLKVGAFPAFDYFGDGSFYLLDSPGHAQGHMCALARTTPDTFVFMGADICHSPGLYRPTQGFPLPDPVPQHHLDPGFPVPCPCSVFASLHPAYPDMAKSRSTPFFSLTEDQSRIFTDIEAAANSIEAMRQFEESPDVLVCIAHDIALVDVLPLLNKDPDADINDWQARGYKEKAQWTWLNDLPRAGKPGRPPFVNGRFWRGQKIELFTDPVGDVEADK